VSVCGNGRWKMNASTPPPNPTRWLTNDERRDAPPPGFFFNTTPPSTPPPHTHTPTNKPQTYQYVKDGSGKARVWDERRATIVGKRVVAAKNSVALRGLENGGMPGVSLEAGHAFRQSQVGGG
jgi:hypothetical protein